MTKPYNLDREIAIVQGLVFATFFLINSGCTTLQGRPATDLSRLALGMPRNEVEKLIGKPATILNTENGIVAHYYYDRGYFAPAEEGGIEASDALMYGGLLIFTGGTIALIGEDCFPECQKGILKVYFDKSDQLIGAVEQAGDMVGGCWDSSKRRDRCEYIFFSRRPSTLSGSVRNAGCKLMLKQR